MAKKNKKTNKKDDVYFALQERFKIVLRAILVAPLGFAFMTWPVIDGFSWTLIPIIPGAILLPYFLITYRSFFKNAKHTALINALCNLLIGYCFATIGSACIFRLLGKDILIIEIIIKLSLSVVLFFHYFKYWNSVWESHKKHNENKAIDLINGRYDYLNPFDMDEYMVKKKSGKQYSNPTITTLISIFAPVGVGIGMILFRKQQYTVGFIIVAVLFLPMTLYYTKVFAHPFYIYRKFIFYEKQIGKPIINGLL